MFSFSLVFLFTLLIIYPASIQIYLTRAIAHGKHMRKRERRRTGLLFAPFKTKFIITMIWMKIWLKVFAATVWNFDPDGYGICMLLGHVLGCCCHC